MPTPASPIRASPLDPSLLASPLPAVSLAESAPHAELGPADSTPPAESVSPVDSDPRAEHGPAGSAPPDHEIPRYDDLRYRDVFWAERDYEDRCDRIAIRALLPPTGGRLIEVGAGYGRLADEYRGYREIVLFDSSEAHVEAARQQFAGDPRIRVEQGDAYALPVADGSFDAVVCVRVVHHLEHPGAVFAEFARVLRPGGVLVLEFANKRNLKAILKFAARRQSWSPFATDPHEYLPLHFDRHPSEVRRLLRRAGLKIEAVRAVSLFRLPMLRARLPAGWLAAVERPLQAPLGSIAPGPSVYLKARRG
ncbi:MAG TPA: class I SAM-dependent methyltransferase [Candidatus Acidoferrales bacterium]|nr:class I SAM-dependent methyltransferase [Candidatus Acidoferrales bacterium]